MEEPRVNFIPCVRWVKRGVTKLNPHVIQLSEKELGDILDTAKKDLNEAEEDVDGLEGTDVESTSRNEAQSGSSDVTDEYNFENYDEEDDNVGALFGIASATVFASNSSDPYVTVPDSEEDSEKEDDALKPDDNLVVVGHVDGDASILEVYVYNHDEGSLYVHHDVLLPSIPLCLEWLDRDVEAGLPGNLVAVGSMDPVITVWDLDIVNCLEPAFKLGHKGSRRRRKKHVGHREAVLDVSWNQTLPHMLASGSVDQTVLLWDLDTLSTTSTLSQFEEKVQTLQWHPRESCTLLVGSCDAAVRLFECQSNSSKTWKVSGEVERVLWDHFNPYHFLVGTNNGNIEYFDVRTDKALWCVAAYEKEVTGLALSKKCRGLLVTAGCESVVKIWDLNTTKPELVAEKKMKLGAIQCLDSNPDLPYIMCAGGDNKKNNFQVWDVLHGNREAQEMFMLRPLTDESAEPMETSDTLQTFQSMSLDQATSSARRTD
ncbi:hypothetical protein PR048_028481 [Dryococelus australis]|uniref:Periodic tryptophan protein 1 homolog n=1 Tax=Dryococelus australis TaxID=614101 RepID=A0ABQ9GAP0_9NEOP|nr:hypothetical protein PR048_028481 [Dryococelus australis]